MILFASGEISSKEIEEGLAFGVDTGLPAYNGGAASLFEEGDRRDVTSWSRGTARLESRDTSPGFDLDLT